MQNYIYQFMLYLFNAKPYSQTPMPRWSGEEKQGDTTKEHLFKQSEPWPTRQ